MAVSLIGELKQKTKQETKQETKQALP